MSDIHQESLQTEGEALYKELSDVLTRVKALSRKAAKGEVRDYDDLLTLEGAATLSSLFGDKDELIVIQNMGKGCPYCTLWADGLKGLLPHMESRAAVVLVSPDEPAVQAEFAGGRGWDYRMVSSRDSRFKHDLGFATDDGSVMPGVSLFTKADGTITNVANDYFGPGDIYCSVWHLFDLFPGGTGDWQPQFSYGGKDEPR